MIWKNDVVEKWTIIVIVVCVLLMFAHYLFAFAISLNNTFAQIP